MYDYFSIKNIVISQKSELWLIAHDADVISSYFLARSHTMQRLGLDLRWQSSVKYVLY